MKLHAAAGVIACCLLSTGCAYLGQRARDFRDVFTLAVEDRTIGCLVPLLVVPFGVHSSDGRGFGLREGYWGSYEHIERWQGPLPGGYGHFDVEFRPVNDYRNKGYRIASDDSWAGPNGQLWLNPQVTVGLYYGLRVGLNLA